MLLCLFTIACSNYSVDNYKEIDSYPSIYPDYTDITIPYNIAPLNFLFTDNIEQYELLVQGEHGSLKIRGKNAVRFRMSSFKNIVERHKNSTLTITVFVKIDNEWIKYKPFAWSVSSYPVDNYLTYRLIEPAYEVWNEIQIAERNVSNFTERIIAANNMADGSCMNCHISNKNIPESSFFHIRHQTGGGTVVYQHGELRKIDTRTENTLSAGVYGSWHPGGRYIAFSTNEIIPEFYSTHDRRMEVYDTSSGLIILDLERNEVFSAPSIDRAAYFETFPEFSADGKTLYFCVTDSLTLPEEYEKLKYSLCAVSFDPESGRIGSKIDTLFDSSLHNKTVSQPRVSPDGKYIMITVFEYGTFPVWHPDARLYLIDTQTSEILKLPEVNNNDKYSNSHHSWSSNSRWFVFASKRDNGMYGKPYFSFIDENGQAHKPFVLPQRNPEFYHYFHKSYNIPELFSKSNKFNALDVERIFKSKAETVKFVGKE